MTPVLHGLAYAVDYAAELVADLPDDALARQPAGVPNHAAWTLGHITFAFELLGTVVGLDPWLPDDWAARFGPGSAPVSDPARYPPRSDLIGGLRDACARLARAVERLEDAELAQAFPDQAYRDVFPTVGHAVTQVLVGHTAFHVGQLSAWRRAIGFGGIGRGFE